MNFHVSHVKNVAMLARQAVLNEGRDKNRAERIRHIREDLMKLTQQEFAVLLGTSRGAVGNWERGGGIRGRLLAKMAEVSSIPMDWIDRGVGDAPTSAGHHAGAADAMDDNTTSQDEGRLLDPERESEQIAAFFRSAPGARKELWQVLTDAVSAVGYLKGDYVIVDLTRREQSGDVVLAMYRDKSPHHVPIFRVAEPPYLVTASIQVASRKPLPIENERVVIRGVVVASGRINHQ